MARYRAFASAALVLLLVAGCPAEAPDYAPSPIEGAAPAAAPAPEAGAAESEEDAVGAPDPDEIARLRRVGFVAMDGDGEAAPEADREGIAFDPAGELLGRWRIDRAAGPHAERIGQRSDEAFVSFSATDYTVEAGRRLETARYVVDEVVGERIEARLPASRGRLDLVFEGPDRLVMSDDGRGLRYVLVRD
jgi:hypothetical protein